MALGRIVLGGRESLVALQPCGRGLLLETLRAADEIRKGSPCFAEVEDGAVDADQLARERELVARKSGAFEPSRFVDRYEAALKELIKAKAAGGTMGGAGPAEGTAEVIDLMQALKKSLAEGTPRPARRGRAEIRDHPAVAPRAQLTARASPRVKPKQAARAEPPSRRRSA